MKGHARTDSLIIGIVSALLSDTTENYRCTSHYKVASGVHELLCIFGIDLREDQTAHAGANVSE